MKSFILSLTLALTVTVGALATPISIVTWNLGGRPGDDVTFASTTVAEHITGIEISRGAGLEPTPVSNSFSSKGWQDFDQPADYVVLGFTVEPGYSVKLDTFSFGSRSSGGAPRFINVSLVNGNTALIDTVTQGADTFTNSVLDLSDFDPVTGTVLIKFSMEGNLPAGTGLVTHNGTWRLVNYFDGSSHPVEITGTVTSVPEPNAIALFAGAVAIGFASTKRTAKTKKV